MKPNPNTYLGLALTASLGFLLAGCGESGESPETSEDSHVHADGSTHAAHEDEAADEGMSHEDEVSLPPVMFADMQIEFAQGHGPLKAGEEGHLVVKLPYKDNGATLVRAWIGTEDRTLSFVGKGEYASSHDDFDIHATAPDPLPENTMWWVEIEKPDGTKIVGSVKPQME